MKKLLSLLLLVSSPLALTDTFIQFGPSEYSDVLSVNKTMVEMNVSKGPWLSFGSVTPPVRILSTRKMTVDYKFNAYTSRNVDGIFNKLEKEAISLCRELADEEYYVQSMIYPSNLFELVIGLSYSILNKDIMPEGSAYLADLKTACNLTISLKEK